MRLTGRPVDAKPGQELLADETTPERKSHTGWWVLGGAAGVAGVGVWYFRGRKKGRVAG